ncbi:kinase-like domain-containing protein [Mycena epipterygia]|nr:kinase-like domain-containing protein [Mycena epipterygia]
MITTCTSHNRASRIRQRAGARMRSMRRSCIHREGSIFLMSSGLKPRSENITHAAPPPPLTAESRFIHELLESWQRRGLVLSVGRSGRVHLLPGETLQGLEAHIGTCMVDILDSRDARQRVRRLQGSDAQACLNAIQHVLDQASLPTASYSGQARRLMRQLSEAQEQLPVALFISGVNDPDEHPTFAGGFGEVYRASYQGRMVALKRIRTFTANSTSHRTRWEFCREAVVWRGLSHRFILPLIGIDRETFPSSFCMVSPWMKQGTVLKYLRDRGRGEVNRLLLEVAQGLEYLHAQNIVHGDLRGTNVLISDDNSACLSDFGLSTTVSDAQTASAVAPSSANHAGSVRWWAPDGLEGIRVRKIRAHVGERCVRIRLCLLGVAHGTPPVLGRQRWSDHTAGYPRREATEAHQHVGRGVASRRCGVGSRLPRPAYDSAHNLNVSPFIRYRQPWLRDCMIIVRSKRLEVCIKIMYARSTSRNTCHLAGLQDT